MSVIEGKAEVLELATTSVYDPNRTSGDYDYSAHKIILFF